MPWRLLPRIQGQFSPTYVFLCMPSDRISIWIPPSDDKKICLFFAHTWSRLSRIRAGILLKGAYWPASSIYTEQKWCESLVESSFVFSATYKPSSSYRSTRRPQVLLLLTVSFHIFLSAVARHCLFSVYDLCILKQRGKQPPRKSWCIFGVWQPCYK